MSRCKVPDEEYAFTHNEVVDSLREHTLKRRGVLMAEGKAFSADIFIRKDAVVLKVFRYDEEEPCTKS